MEIRGIPHSCFHRAIDVALKTSGLRYGRNLFRLEQTAGFGRVKGNDIRGLLPNDLQRILRGPGAFVCHDRSIHSPRHLSHRFDPLHGLFHVGNAIFFHGLDGAYRGLYRGVALIGVHSNLNPIAHCLPDLSYELHISFGLDTALQLDRFYPLVLYLERFLYGFVDLHKTDAVGHWDSLPITTAEQLISRHAERLSSNIVKGHVDGGLAVWIAFDRLIHKRVERCDPAGVLSRQGRREDVTDDPDRRCGRLAVILHVIAAPIFEDRGFAEAYYSFVGLDSDDDVDSNRSGEARPLVNPARGKLDRNRLDSRYLHCPQPTWISWSVGVESESSSQPLFPTAIISLF